MATDLLVPGWISSRGWMIAGWTMLHFLWIGAAIGLLAAVVRLLLWRARPAARYGAAVLLFALLAIAPVLIALRVSAVLPEPSLETSRSAAADQGAAAPGSLSATPPTLLAPDTQPLRRESDPAAVWTTGLADGAAEPGSTAVVPADDSEAKWAERAVVVAIRVLPGFWITGSSLLLIVWLTGLHGSGRLQRSSQTLKQNPVADMCASLARSLRIARRVSVAVCDRLSGPILVGIVRPCILLPPAALTGWTPQQVEMVLLHELAHIRRWDNLVNLVQRLVESLLFFQPAVWWISGWMRLERELCCDEAVVRRTGRRRDYAETLLMISTAAGRVPPAASPSGSAPAIGSSMARSHLVPRIRRLLQKGPEPMQISRTATLIVLACFAAAILVPLELTRRTTQAQEPEAQDPQAADDPAGDLRDEPPLVDSPPANTPTTNEPAAQVPQLADPLRNREPDIARPADGDADPMQPGWPIAVNGMLSPGQSLTIAARQDGVLETLDVREGDRVQKGDTLASFPQDRLRITELEVQVASKTLEQAESTYARAKELGEARGIARTELERIRFDFETAALHVDRARAEYDLLKQALVIRAPIDGVVTRLYHAAGESVKAGERIVQLDNTQQMQVEGYVDLTRVWQVRPGAPVEVRVDIPKVDLPVERSVFVGEITFVDAGVDRVSHEMRVRARVKNRDGLLKAGLPVEMAIHKPQGDDQNPDSNNESDR